MARNLNIPFDPAMFDTPEARSAALDSLVNQRALTTYAVKRGVVVTDDRLREVITAIPAVQEGGQFSKDRYDRLLAAQGYTPAAFENRLRQDLSMQALNTGVGESAFAPRAVQAMITRAQGETREVQEFILKDDSFAAAVKLAPEAARGYYDANLKEFARPAEVKVEYVVLSVEAIAATLTAPPEEVKAFYDQNIAKYRQDEQRQASHILVKFEEKSDRAALKARAEDILKQVKAPGADFAALAGKLSQDPGSAAQGGSLGSFGRGSMVKAFEDAVFAMKEGEISGVVESEFGYHVIKLTGIKAGKVRTLDEVRGEIEKEWTRAQAQKKFTDSAEGFTNTVYEQADSLKPAADKYKLKVQAAESFSRAAPPRTLSHPRVLERLFSDDALKAKRNTEAVEVSPGVMVSARVTEYKPQATKPFDQVEAEIKASLARKEAATLARKDGEAKLKAAQESPSALEFGAARALSRAKPDGLAPDALRAVMTAPVVKLPVIVGTPVAGGYAIFRINKVSEGATGEPGRQAAIKSALDRAQAEADFGGYLESVKQSAKVVVYKDKLEKKSN